MIAPGDLLVEADDTGQTLREYVWLDDMPLAVVSDVNTASPNLYFVHADHLDTPVRMTDGSKSVVWDAYFLPFGSVESITGSASNNLRFPGQYFLIEDGLHYNWYRHYDPTLGRYLQADLLGLINGASIYTYAASSPVLYVDPDGRVIPVLLAAAAGGAASGFVFGGIYDIAQQLAHNGFNINCVDLTQAGWAALEGAAWGAILGPLGRMAWIGAEIKIGKNIRIAPFGNRTGNSANEIPHYHRRGIDPDTGDTIPGQGIGRHRPWEIKSTDSSFWDRF